MKYLLPVTIKKTDTWVEAYIQSPKSGKYYRIIIMNTDSSGDFYFPWEFATTLEEYTTREIIKRLVNQYKFHGISNMNYTFEIYFSIEELRVLKSNATLNIGEIIGKGEGKLCLSAK
jgi:hypothetical protein